MEGTPDELEVRVFRLRMDPHRLIYGTIILMTAFALYDTRAADGPLGAWPILELSAVVIAPLFALTMAHTFSEALDLQIRKKSALNGRDRRRLLASNMQYLYLAVPPIALVIVLTVFGLDTSDVITVVQLLGLGSLFGWGYYAGTKAEISHGRRFLMASGYLVTGAFIIGVEQLLTH